MTGRERILAALDRREPDMLPTMEWALHPEVIRAVNGSESDIEFVRAADLDGIAVSLNYRKTTLDSRHIVDEWGVTRVTYDDYPNPVAFPIASEADFDDFVVPDPDDEYRYGSIRRALKEIGSEKAIVARVKDVVSHPRDLMGFEEFLVGFYTQPSLIARLMEMCVEHSSRIARNLRELGVEVIVIGDDIANNQGLLLSPEMYRAQVYPHFTKLMDLFTASGLKVIKHSDGDLRSIVQDLVESGISCLDPIDPLGNMDIAEVKANVGDRIALKGNVDCVHTLVDGTEENVVRDTLNCILSASIGGGHIISSSNSIHRGISPGNYRRFLDTVREYGTYPIDADRIKDRLDKT